MEKEIKIPAIKDGSVIDHIPSRDTFRIIRILDPQEFKHTINLALNLKSKKMGKKGVIKIDDRYLTEEEVNKIGILAPHATVSIIKNYKVKEKIRVEAPKQIKIIVQCSNPNCITNMEDVKTDFSILSQEPLKIFCKYCERSMGREDIELVR